MRHVFVHCLACNFTLNVSIVSFVAREAISHALICAAESLWQESFFVIHCCSFSFVSPYSLTELSTHSFANFRTCVFIGPSFPTDLHVEHPSPPSVNG
jgi:hypothetical protein